MKFFLIGLMALSINIAANAGNGGVGGGVGYVFKKKVYLADSFSLRTLPVYKKLKKLMLDDIDKATADVVSAISQQNPELAKMLTAALTDITPCKRGRI